MTIPPTEEMDSIQVFSDLPAVRFNEEFPPGGFRFDSPMAGMDGYPEYIDFSERRSQSAYAAPTFQMNPFVRPLNFFAGGELLESASPKPSFYQLLYNSHSQQEGRAPWCALRSQQPMGPYDNIASCSDGSLSPGESAHSPLPSIGSYSSSPAESMSGNTPLTPFSNIHGGYSSHQHVRHSSILSGKSVSMRDVEYDPPSEIDAPHEKDEDELQTHFNHSLRPAMEEEFPSEEDEDAAPTDEDGSSDYSPVKRKTTASNVRSRRGNRSYKSSIVVKTSPVIKSGIAKSKPRRRGTAEITTDLARSSNEKNRGNTDKTASTERRRFICSFYHYGCTSTFANKNEWKRHTSSQHVKPGFYRCDIGECNPQHQQQEQHPQVHHHHHSHELQSQHQPSHRRQSSRNATSEAEPIFNDFNRKDLFTQHLRRMHAPWSPTHSRSPTQSNRQNSQGPQQSTSPTPARPLPLDKTAFDALLGDIHKRCYVTRRDPPPSSTCGFCGKRFLANSNGHSSSSGSTGTALAKSWEERMEHVGKHLEAGQEAEAEDPAIREWGLQEGILVHDHSGGLTLAG